MEALKVLADVTGEEGWLGRSCSCRQERARRMHQGGACTRGRGGGKVLDDSPGPLGSRAEMLHRLVLRDTLRRDPCPNQGETDSGFLPGEGEEKSLHRRFLAAQGLSHCHAGSTQGIPVSRW